MTSVRKDPEDEFVVREEARCSFDLPADRAWVSPAPTFFSAGAGGRR
jgi:hypothetical protein